MTSQIPGISHPFTEDEIRCIPSIWGLFVQTYMDFSLYVT